MPTTPRQPRITGPQIYLVNANSILQNYAEEYRNSSEPKELQILPSPRHIRVFQIANNAYYHWHMRKTMQKQSIVFTGERGSGQVGRSSSANQLEGPYFLHSIPDFLQGYDPIAMFPSPVISSFGTNSKSSSVDF